MPERRRREAPETIVVRGRASIGIAALAVGLARTALSELPPIVPREVLFGNPVKTAPSLSPDGTRLAFLAPDDKGVLNVWVQTLGKEDAAAVTRESHRTVNLYRWAEDGEHILYEQDSDGDENWHVYSVDLATREVRDLTPFSGVKAQNLLTSPAHPDEILIGLNRRERRVFDMYRVRLSTGAVTLETENPGDVLSWTVDPDFVIRAATAFDLKTAQTILRVRDGAGKPWRDLVAWPFEDSTMFGQINGGTVTAGFAADGRSLYVVSALHSDTARLVRVDAQTGKELETIAEDPRSDVAEDFAAFPDFRPLVLTHPKTHRVEAVGFEYLEFAWKFVDPAVKADFETLAKDHPGFLLPVSHDRDDSKWIVAETVDAGPQSFLLYDRKSRTANLLFVDQPALSRYRLTHRKPVLVPARDGLKLVSYLTLPPGGPQKSLPMVLVPHGGPWARDDWGFDGWAQFLANRGYAVLQVNFRGSTGFGKKFLNAGNHQFGLGMQEDLHDGVRWAIREGIADPKRIGIMGASGGGYAALRGVTTAPELFVCAVDLVGPTDLKVLFTSMPSYWGAVKTRWVRRMGDVEHDEDLNRRLSPLYHVDRIQVPVLIGQGANDPRVNIKNSDLIVEALRKRGLSVTYVVYPDEGHGFARPENNLDFFGRVEEFLAKHLGGRSEPWKKIPGSTAEPR
jgi:dipeptidyl aminopeptidase/acylaminoacyl peptidase